MIIERHFGLAVLRVCVPHFGGPFVIEVVVDHDTTTDTPRRQPVLVAREIDELRIALWDGG